MPRKIKMKIDDAKMKEHWEMHRKMMGCKMLVLGALVLANAYWNVVSWANFIGIMLVLAGIMKLAGHCKCKK